MKTSKRKQENKRKHGNAIKSNILFNERENKKPEGK